ncbi:MAG TPA: tetratricopeptide repeat protein [Vicinamibacteria bacterium]|nr:tetratricopeptide repeat protein [Vicinamibacteria bacterium]
MHRRQFATLLSCAVLGCAVSASAQMGTGRVTGSVHDVEGKPIEGATITATSPESERTLEVTSDKDGKWALLGFRSGTYEFTFSAPGFKPQAYKQAIKQMGRNPSMDVVMEPLGQGQSGGAMGGLLEEANTLFEQKDYAGAIAKYEAILADEPTLYQVHYNIGSARREMGQLDEAKASYEKVLAQDPMNTAALVSVGDILVQQGDLDKAVEYFEKAIDQTQDEIVPFNVAEIYMSQGNAAKALEFYQLSSSRKPDWPEAHLKIAYAQVNLGDLAAARASFEKVVAIAPDSPQAQVAEQMLASLPQ